MRKGPGWVDEQMDAQARRWLHACAADYMHLSTTVTVIVCDHGVITNTDVSTRVHRVHIDC